MPADCRWDGKWKKSFSIIHYDTHETESQKSQKSCQTKPYESKSTGVKRSSTNSFTNLQILNTRFSMIQQFKDCSNLQNSQNSQARQNKCVECIECSTKLKVLYYRYNVYTIHIQIYIYIIIFVIWYTKVSSRRTSRVPPLLLHAALRAAQFGLPHCAARPRPEGWEP